MERWIAAVELVAARPDGSRAPLALRIAAPAAHPDGSWTCWIDLGGLHDGLVPMHGEDALQALCLALGLAASILRDFQERGGRLEYPDGGELPLEAYFGAFGAFAPDA